jgi:hypothetical protein
METYQKSNSVLWETGAYLAQLEKENEVIEKQLKELLSPSVNEEETIKEYDLPKSEPVKTGYSKSDKESLYQQQITYLETRKYGRPTKNLRRNSKRKRPSNLPT